VEQGSVPALGELQICRRRLPHWRLPGSVYFVTWRLHPNQARELSPAERSAVAEAIKHFDGERYVLHAWAVMNDHAHALVQPLAEWALSQILHSWKSFAANRLQREFGREGAVWQDESFDRIMRNDEEYFEKFNYILTNAQRRWPDMTEAYEWVGTGIRAATE
jgi:putative transposase